MLRRMSLGPRPGLFTSGLLFVAGTLAGAAACNVDTTGTPPMLAPHCVDEFADQTCSFRFPTKPYCDKCRPASDDQGCSATPPQTPACIPDDPGAATFTTTGMDTDPSTGSTTQVGTTLDSSSISASLTDGETGGDTTEGFICAGADGTFDEECADRDDTTPYCVQGVCTGCSDAGGNEFCSTVAETTPSCDIATGQCVSCLDAPETFSCEDATPVCSDTGACTPCSSHDQCPDTACHLDPSDVRVGRCFADDERLWVDNTAICPGLGTEASPNCSLESAVSTIAAGANVVILVADTGVPYDENPTMAADATVAIRGQGGPVVSGFAADDTPSIVIQDGIVYIDSLRINDNANNHGLTCDGATVWLQNSELTGNDLYGVFGEGPCDMRVEAVNIYANDRGGLRQFGGRLELYNTAIGLNGDGGGGPGLNLLLAEVEILYATIVANAAAGTADNIQCLDSSGVVRNSAIVGVTTNSVQLDCFTLQFSRNAIDTTNFVGADGTLVDVVYNANWFVNPAGGDFRLGAPPLTPFVDAALWLEGDPEFDADGTARPQGDVSGYAGVDEP
jgi:hypothetical protein